MYLTCKAYWVETDTSEEYALARAKEYGFNQHPEVAANVVQGIIRVNCR